MVEATLPARLGLARDLIRTLREEILEKGRHWVKVHRDILLTEEAVGLLLQAHAALKTAAPPSSQAVAPKLATDENGEAQGPVKTPPTVLQVLRRAPVNPKMLHAVLPSDPATTVFVRVQSNTNYLPGMTVYATKLNPLLYAVQGRMPAWPGEKLYRED